VLNVKVTYYDGPPADAAAIMSSAKFKMDRAIKAAKAAPQNPWMQTLAQQAIEAYDKAEANVAIQPNPELRAAVAEIAARYGARHIETSPYSHLIVGGSPHDIMKDPDLNALAPIQIETIAA
jgi:aspartate/methionine/tyrosine aminotransferase